MPVCAANRARPLNLTCEKCVQAMSEWAFVLWAYVFCHSYSVQVTNLDGTYGYTSAALHVVGCLRTSSLDHFCLLSPRCRTHPRTGVLCHFTLPCCWWCYVRAACLLFSCVALRGTARNILFLVWVSLTQRLPLYLEPSFSPSLCRCRSSSSSA